jgi:two-component system NarL family sensor kinase
MTAVLTATALLSVVTTASGWFIRQSGRAQWSATCLVLGGVALLLGCAAVVLDLDGAASPVLGLAGCLLLPLAVLAYPRLTWREPVSFVLLVVVVGAGVLSVAWEESFELMGFVLVGALLLHVWWALERGDADDRRALAWSSLAWISAGLAAAFVGFLSESMGTTSVPELDAAYVVVLTVGPVAMVVGVVRPEVVDVRGLVTRAVVAATVLTVYVAVAVGLASAVEQLSGRPLEPTPTVVLCAVLAFGVRPLQVMLRGVVDQLLFGDRPDPLAAATSLADRIGDDPALALAAVREALVLPYASIRAGGEVLASSGTEVTHTRVLPLRLGEDEVGEVVVGLRAGDFGLSRADEDVLRIVAPLLAQTLRARRMSEDLQRSREAVVAAVEEERRRLRRDLHDGLGPTLSGVAFATDAARNQVRSDPDKADELLVQLRSDTAHAITEIRRLVEGLRPPALDELGLEGAIRQHASTLHSSTGLPLPVSVSVPTALPALSAATEVAAYRIVVEALTNVVRHASATGAVVELGIDDRRLLLAVRDDGGPGDEWTPGVGIASMRERALQVGGTLTAYATTGGGVVEAAMPLGASDW